MHKYLPAKLETEAVDTLIDAVTGVKVDLCLLVDAAYHVEGYVLGKLVPCDHPIPMATASLTPREKADLLKQLVAPADVVAAPEIPWALIWQIVRQIIDQYIKG